MRRRITDVRCRSFLLAPFALIDILRGGWTAMHEVPRAIPGASSVVILNMPEYQREIISNDATMTSAISAMHPSGLSHNNYMKNQLIFNPCVK